MNISVVIPAYNEEARIGESLTRIKEYLDNNLTKSDKYEIIVVDDGSTDKTVDVVNRLSKPKNKSKADIHNIRILRNEINSGKGFSVKKGIENSKYDLVLFTDADLATPIKELGKMIKEIENGYDIAIASRNLPGSDIAVIQPRYRQIMGKTFPLIAHALLIPNIKDSQCGFKLFKTEAAKQIVKLQRINGYSFDVELLYIAQKLGFRIKEVPVKWIDKKGSKVDPLRDGFKMFIDLLKIRFNAFAHKYEP